MDLENALGLGSGNGGTVVPVSIWVPVLVVFSVLAGALLGSLEGESALTQFLVAVLVGVMVVAVSTGITLWRARRR